MFGFKSAPKDAADKPAGLFASLRQRLSKTRENLSSGLGDLLLGKKQIDDDLLEQLEDQLLMADVGMQATQRITNRLTDRLARKQLGDSDSLIGALKATMSEIAFDRNRLVLTERPRYAGGPDAPVTAAP